MNVTAAAVSLTVADPEASAGFLEETFDFEREMAADGFVSDPASPAADTYDGLHPNERGEVKIAAAVAEALEELGIFSGPLAADG